MEFNIPLQYKTGEFKLGELSGKGEILKLDYDENYKLLTYNVPMYENEARIYTVPKEPLLNAAVVYGNEGTLDKIELTEADRTKLIYIRFKNIKASEKGVLKYVKEQADKMSDEIIKRKQKLARLFFGKFYDGEAVEIAVKPAVAEEMQAVIDEYDGDTTAADNSGNYPVEKMIMLDYEPLAVMLMCTDSVFQSMLFNLAANAVEERIKSRVLKKISTTDDFKFIVEECD